MKGHMNVSLLYVTVCVIWINKNSDLFGKFHCRCIKRQGYSTVNTAHISASYLSYLHRSLVSWRVHPPNKNSYASQPFLTVQFWLLPLISENTP